jgi:glycosyltransferase involved in cell wall biosynthesis
VPLPLEYALFLGDAIEVWVPSEAAAVAIRVGARAPVLALPPLVGAGFDPLELSTRPGCRFVTRVDGRESFARQNPWASIAAFRRAFAIGERGSEARLVVVANDLDPRSEGARRLRLEVDRADAELINVTRDAVVAQLAGGDVFLSLHRSEAFGTEILDVMGMARPVVATAFLGVREYLNGRNGCPVGYAMREADPGDFYLDANVPEWARRGECWADPDIEQAARWMRKLAASPSLRRLLGERAATTVQQLGEFELNLEAQTWRVIDRGRAMRQRARLAKAEGRWRVDELLGRHGGAGLAAAGAGANG